MQEIVLAGCMKGNNGKVTDYAEVCPIYGTDMDIFCPGSCGRTKKRHSSTRVSVQDFDRGICRKAQVVSGLESRILKYVDSFLAG